MPAENLGVLGIGVGVGVGVPFRVREAPESDPPVRVCIAQRVHKRFLSPVLIPCAGERCRPLARFAAAERGPSVHRAAHDPDIEGEGHLCTVALGQSAAALRSLLG